MKYNSFYNRYITKDGLVFGVNKEGKLYQCKISKNSVGYEQVSGYDKANHKSLIVTVHRLMWLTYKGPIPNGYEIDHIDNNKYNNTLSNLQLLSRAANVRKYHALGIPNPRKGTKTPDETRKKISEAKRRVKP